MQDHISPTTAADSRHASSTIAATYTADRIHALSPQAATGPLANVQSPSIDGSGITTFSDSSCAGLPSRSSESGGEAVSHINPGGLPSHQALQPDSGASLRSLSPHAERQEPPSSHVGQAGSQPPATVTGVADLYRNQPPRRRAISSASRFDAAGARPQAEVRPTSSYQDHGDAAPSLMSHPEGQPPVGPPSIPRSSSPRGVAELYRRGGSSFGPAGGPSSSSKRSRGGPSQATPLNDPGSRPRIRDARRQAPGTSSSEIAGSRASSSLRSMGPAEGPAGRSDGIDAQTDAGHRRRSGTSGSGTRRSGSRDGRERPDVEPSEPRLASISVNRRSAEGRLKPQQELSPRSHARQVSGDSPTYPLGWLYSDEANGRRDCQESFKSTRQSFGKGYACQLRKGMLHREVCEHCPSIDKLLPK